MKDFYLLHLKVPFVDDVTKVDKRTQSVTFNGNEGNRPLAAASKDLQDVTIEANINFQVNPASVEKFVTTYRDDYRVAVIEPIVIERVKTFSAQYTAEELVTKRAEFSDKIFASLRDALAEKEVILTKFSITNFTFSAEFTKSIEAKVTAIQNAEAAKNKLEQTKYEGEQQIVTAKAQAETIRIQAEAINSQGGADYVNLKAVERWNGILPVQMIPGATVPFINLTK